MHGEGSYTTRLRASAPDRRRAAVWPRPAFWPTLGAVLTPSGNVPAVRRPGDAGGRGVPKDKTALVEMLRKMILIREFDLLAIELRKAKKIYGALHPYVGE